MTLEPPRSIVPRAEASSGEVWSELGLSRAVLGRFLRAAQMEVDLRGEVAELLSDDRRLRRLNRESRGKDKPTDALSFPVQAKLANGHAGDLAISLETATRQVREHGHSLRDELRVLLLHGVLDLAGMDHETDRGEMAGREAELREAASGLPSGVDCADGKYKRKYNGKSFERKGRKVATQSTQTNAVAARCFRMVTGFSIAVFLLLCLLTLAAYIDRIYFEIGKVLSREYTDNIEAWEEFQSSLC